MKDKTQKHIVYNPAFRLEGSRRGQEYPPPHGRTVDRG